MIWVAFAQSQRYVSLAEHGSRIVWCRQNKNLARIALLACSELEKAINRIFHQARAMA